MKDLAPHEELSATRPFALNPYLADSVDRTKVVHLVFANVSTATTRTWNALDSDGTIQLNDGAFTENFIPRYNAAGVLIDSGISDDSAIINVDASREYLHDTLEDISMGDMSGLASHSQSKFIHISDANNWIVANSTGGAVWIGDWTGLGNSTLFGVDDSTNLIYSSSQNVDIEASVGVSVNTPSFLIGDVGNLGNSTTIGLDDSGQTGSIYANEAFMGRQANPKARVSVSNTGHQWVVFDANLILFRNENGVPLANGIAGFQGSFGQIYSIATSGLVTFLTTPTSANLAAFLTDETGSGKAIFSAATFTSTASTTLTFPTASTTIAGLGTTQTFTGVNTFTPAARATPSVAYFTITTPADTAIGLNSEAVGLDLTAATRTWATGGTVSLQRERYFRAPTYASAGSTTITRAVNLYVEDPVAGSGTTITTAAGQVSAFAIYAKSTAWGHATNSIKILEWTSQSTSWIDMPTGGGACGIGSGGPGNDAWLGFASGAGNWFGNSAIGDICIRALSTGLLLGNSSSTYTLKIQSDQITIRDQANIAVNATTGTKIGTATSQKLGFWNATPIVQPTTSITGLTFVANSGTAVNDASTFGGYTLKQLAAILKNTGFAA